LAFVYFVTFVVKRRLDLTTKVTKHTKLDRWDLFFASFAVKQKRRPRS
jgi:hypothetical protein